jgi:hypothetical protein
MFYEESMEEFSIIKAIAGLLSAIGTMALYRYHLAQSSKLRGELLEKLDNALAEEHKHSVCELFRLLHGLRMDYTDIKAICEHDKATKIILALQKTPGIVKHENGRLQYTDLYEKDWVRKSNGMVNKIFAYSLGVLTLSMVIVMGFMDGVAALALLVFVIPSAVFFMVQVKDIRHDKMVESLVEESGT